MVYEYQFEDYLKQQAQKESRDTKRDTCLNSVMIRISQKNCLRSDNDVLGYKTGDVVIIAFDTILKILSLWAKEKKGLSYYAIVHNEDENNVHYHIVITFSKSSKCRFLTLKKKFPYGSIEPCHSGAKSCVQYLVHMNNPEKHQYNWSQVITNNPEKMEEYRIPGKATDKVKFLKLQQQILTGEIREFELYDSTKVDPQLCIKYSKQLKETLSYRAKQILLNPKRDINVIYLQGATATGKTTYCITEAERQNKSIFVSGSSNDFLEGIAGQECLVVDDFTFEAIKMMDFSKFIDPHYGTLTKSRYHNRAFIGDTIFITSNRDLLSIYPNERPKERAALFRKINRVLKFEHTDTYGISKITTFKIAISCDENDVYHFALEPIEERMWDFRNIINGENFTEEGSIY